jgi:DNA repair exonuclease SbcCD ATPase subunit
MNARENLKKVTAEGAKLTRQAEQLETALATATASVQTATAELRTFADLDAAIKRFRVDAVKSGGNSRDLPEKLKARLAARRDAEEELTQSTDTLAAIADEMEEVRNRLKPSDEKKRNCALDVLREHADQAAAELIVLNARRRDLRQILGGLAELSLPFDGKMQFVGFTSKMASAIEDLPDEFSGNLFPQADMGRRWKGRLDALLSDSDAAISTPKPIRPSDYDFKSIPWEGPGFRQPTLVTTLRSET